MFDAWPPLQEWREPRPRHHDCRATTGHHRSHGTARHRCAIAQSTLDNFNADSITRNSRFTSALISAKRASSSARTPSLSLFSS